MATFTLQILHASDLEGGVDAIANAPNFAAVVDALETDAATTGFSSILLSAGDNVIPGPFFNASQFIGDQIFTDTYNAIFAEELDGELLTSVGDGRGFTDIAIMNILGFDASAVGNHEFDSGPDAFETLIEEALDDNTIEDVFGASIADIEHFGVQFPYLSANLDFSNEPNLANLFTDNILPSSDYRTVPDSLLEDGGANPFKLAASTIVEADGQQIGVVGATTQRVSTISSTGGVESTAGTVDDMAALAADIQPDIDALVAQGLDKIVLVSHLQDFNLEAELATLLTDVDVIIAGGSDTRSADDQDRLREGDVAEQPYPALFNDADGNPVVVVSTDGEYSYVGRLVIEFDEDGFILPASIDADVSGAYATDEQGVLDVTGAATLADAISASEKATLVDNLTTAVQDLVTESDGVVFGETSVFLDGRRETVRTEESNFGNLTADANLAAAKSVDTSVVVSLKNGGGIRAPIGEINGDTGELLPTVDNPASGKEAGEISELDIQNALRFNNGLTLLTLSSEDLKVILEHAVASSGPGSTPGQFPQVGGLRFSFDASETAQVLNDDGSVATSGERVKTVSLETEDGLLTIVRDGEVVEGAPESIRLVTLNFLADGGDGYPFQELGEDFVITLADGSSISQEAFYALPEEDQPEILGEQQALQEFLAENFPVDGDASFDAPETSAAFDTRIQQLDARLDLAAAPEKTSTLSISEIARFDSGVGEGGAEIVKHEDGVLYVTNGEADAVDLFDVLGGSKITSIDLTTIDGYDGVNSLDVKDELLAVAIAGEGAENGQVAFYDVSGATPTLINTVEAGNLPDMVTFTPDGSKVLVANEGEPVSANSNPVGSVSIIDLANGAENAAVQEISFASLNGTEDQLRADGIRIFPGFTAAEDLEPEFIAVSPDGTTAYVTLQENNAFALIDIESGTLTEVISQGTVDFSEAGNEADVSNRDDGINIQNWPAEGFRMADGMASFEINGETYFITANEGDAREYTVEEEGVAFEGGEILDLTRVGDLTLDLTAFPDAEELQQDENLGRLETSTIDGDTDGDGDVDQIFAFGGRSVSIFDAAGNLVSDTGGLFAKIAATLNEDEFQANDGDFDGRSDDAGVEPESVAVGVVGGRTYAFVGLERDSGIVVMDISNPKSPEFVEYFNGSDTSGDVSPEGIQFVSAEDSPTGAPVLVVSYEVSGTTAVYALGDGEGVVIKGAVDGGLFTGSSFRDRMVAGEAEDQIIAGGGDDSIGAGGGDDAVFAGAGDDRVLGGAGDDELRGSLGNDVIRGGEGDDAIFGGAGDDILRGNAGNDEILGNAGDDILDGGAGDDVLNGGLGVDRLSGGEGADTFVFVGPFETDVVRDFDAGVDQLMIGGVSSFDDLTLTQNGDNTIVTVDANRSVILNSVDADDLAADDFIF
ncbi:MAG: choice-of-anchor I family protein [Rhodobacteraceae bacterium]|nr:choice-of-anchor I family protein [Paracoccaceae bacterium]